MLNYCAGVMCWCSLWSARCGVSIVFLLWGSHWPFNSSLDLVLCVFTLWGFTASAGILRDWLCTVHKVDEWKKLCILWVFFVCLLFLVLFESSYYLLFGFSKLWSMFLFVLSLTIIVAFVGFLFEFEFCQFCSFYFILFVLYIFFAC